MSRKVLIAAAVTMVAALATACTTPGSAPAAKVDPSQAVQTDISGLPATTLSVWTSESGNRLDILKRLGDRFHEKYPNVTVNWTVRDFGSYPAQIKLALSSNDGPDVAIGNLGWSLDGPLIKAGLFRPLDDYAKAYGWDTRYPEVGLRQLRFTEDGKKYGEGPIWGTPYASDVIGWFYNGDLLNQIGAQAPATMDELEGVLAKSKAAGQQPIVFGNKDGWPVWHLVYDLVGQYCTPDQVAGVVYGDQGATYQDACIAQAVNKVVEWKNAGYIRDDVNAIAQADAGANFRKGQGLFFPAGSWEASDMPAQVGFFLTPPRQQGGPVRAVGSFGYAFHIAARSDNVAAGAAFVDWMSNEDAAREFFASGDIAPLPVDSPKLKDGKVFSDIYGAWSTVLENDNLLPYLEFATPTSAEVNYPVLQRILGGQQSVDDGLKAIEESRAKFIAENAG
ncbi:ABC transporter substrate-binding protein [Asanoa iriomotensis]|uniref:Sugar ABC transporter substrate-binding protein n=1 Tax=Asanoa iriomotensis TaxID=234613 RepID=A0ABQ4C022_9ACTN|nr:extracellular solute-binding protein [Asanoa iriomotensis]GIF55766.1 sugar ABC transporter substrate-binding protein [Asanoa iriomotensis]